MWVVTLTYNIAPGEDKLDSWANYLDQIDASVANIPGRGVDITIWMDGPDPVKAATMAREAVEAIVPDAPLGVEVVTAFEHERRADAPTLPEMVSSPEAAGILGVSRQRLHQLRHNPGFPLPLLELRTGPIWNKSAVEKFASTWTRKAGRPKVHA